MQASLRGRPAGYSVIRECLDFQLSARPRGSLRRILGFNPLHPDARSWFAGAVGEIHVGSQLERLGPEWVVLHAVPVGKGESDIDHVVVGPPGVFTVNTKHHSGAKVWVGSRMVMIAGQKTDHVRNSVHEAERASKLLSLAAGLPVVARSLLVIVDPASVTVKQQPDRVTVLTARELVRWLKRRKPTLDAADVVQIAEAASDARTWHRTADGAVDDAHLQAFGALRREVNQARTRRMLWVAAAAIALVVVTFQMVVPALLGALVNA
ncbi:nuclease-like protein [Homoserinimonas aerilata]|uniref:Nuclease-like protein n=1 Tax=Homoserinimonas aerilata TaxID=1162970 RepID=A0A542YGA8_9MICO|nr:nuclease-related domain-containing protein [Homoserinimonas aerilata]TQL47115.1 nuclease-like protein [Homoserinimonas aerilata]